MTEKLQRHAYFFLILSFVGDVDVAYILCLVFLLMKIADLGLATCKAWSKLTKEESRRQSRSRRKPQSNAGTLYYMAPEHLDSINSRSTEKSDIYSFGIVVWVILANKEPYESKYKPSGSSTDLYLVLVFVMHD